METAAYSRRDEEMQPTDPTIEVLKDIRDEVRGLRGEVADTNAILATTNASIEALRIDTNARIDSLGHHQAETEIRLSTDLGAVAGAVREVRDLLRDDRELRRRVDDHERRLVAIERHRT
jgi:hypothetical protein